MGVDTTNGFFYLPDIGASGTTEKGLYDAGQQRADTRLGYQVWVGDPNYGNTLEDCITAIGSDAVTLNLPSALTYSITANLSVPANISLRLEKGAILSIATGVTVSIYGYLDAGLYQIFSCSGTGAVAFAPGSQVEVYPEWWTDNAVPGTTDMTAALQAAIIAYPNVKLQSTIYNITSAITSYPGTITGVPCEPYSGMGYPTTAIPGTWLQLNHTGKGFVISCHGVTFHSIATFRSQPTPAGGWAPTANDYDFWIGGGAYYDITFRDICVLNPTKGFGVFDGGRVNFFNIKGQPFQKGIVIEYAVDICRIDHVHFWPFWSTSNNVYTYTKANMDALQISRADHPFVQNFFSIYCRSVIRISETANGSCNRFSFYNVDCDTTKYGFWVDDSVVGTSPTGPPSGMMTNLNGQGGPVGSKGIFIEGHANITFTDVRFDWINAQAVHVTHDAVVLRFHGDFTIYNYDQDAADCPAVDLTAGNDVSFDGKVVIGGSGGTGGKYSATGTISVDDWREWTPVITATAGAYDTLGTVTGTYKRIGTNIYFNLYVEMLDVDTATGAMIFTLPTSTPASPVYYNVGHGCMISNGLGTPPYYGDQLYVIATPSVDTGFIYTYDTMATRPVWRDNYVVVVNGYYVAAV